MRVCARGPVIDGAFQARVLFLPSPLARDRELVGKALTVEVAKSFVRVASNMIVELDATNERLDELYSQRVDEHPLRITSDVHPCPEPSIRVPLSLLKELRGQEAEAEAQRQTLLTVRD
jgi:hypothetical protein